MAYSAPELLLVGAAQNLVLATSDFQNEAGACKDKRLEESDPWLIYDGSGLW